MKRVAASLFRPALSGLVRRLPPVHERLRIPRRAFRTTAEWMAERGSSLPGVALVPLDPAVEVTRQEPVRLDPGLHWIFRRDRADRNWPTFVLKLPGGRVLRHDGVVLTPDGALLGDVSRESGREPSRHSLLGAWRLPPLTRRRGTVAVLTVIGGNQYFHWLLDLLPRLDLLRRAGFALDRIDAFVVNGFDQPFQRETLARFGIGPERVVCAAYEMHLEAETLLVPSLAGTSGNMLAGTPPVLRHALCPARIPDGKTRLYVRRNDVTYRRVLNDDAVVAALAPLGFEPVTLTGMPVAEQAALFARAEAIVGCHGAGFSNLVFCGPGTKVFEFFSPRYVNACYYALADRVGASYHYLVGEGDAPPEGVDPHEITADVTVDVPKLRALLAKGGL